MASKYENPNLKGSSRCLEPRGQFLSSPDLRCGEIRLVFLHLAHIMYSIILDPVCDVVLEVLAKRVLAPLSDAVTGLRR